MLVERLYPPRSRRYNILRDPFTDVGAYMDSIGLIQLFTIWTLTVAGMVMEMGLENRFAYWEWGGWIFGILKLAIVTAFFILILHPKQIWIAGKKRLNEKEFGLHLGIAALLLIFGSLGSKMVLNQVIGILPYLAAFLGGLTIFQFVIEFDQTKGTWYNYHWSKKNFYLMISVSFMFAAVGLGFYFDDPIITSAGVVALPFPVIALIWPSHVRHLQRARFYPLFILAMFLCVRAPWFIVPLAGLFYTLRTVNYFRYGIVYPSFGVDFHS